MQIGRYPRQRCGDTVTETSEDPSIAVEYVARAKNIEVIDSRQSIRRALTWFDQA